MKRSTISFLCAALSLSLLLMACGGGGSTNNGPANQQANAGTVNTIISDDTTQDWATIGVKVLSVTLTPQSGGTPVTIYTAPSSGAPFINLVQLDQLGEIIGNAPNVPVGTYSQATITVSGNPADILLTSSSDPETGFPYTTPTTVPTGQIQVVGASGSPLTVPVKVNLSPVLNVTNNSSNALDLEFDLSHPAFIVQHTPPSASGSTIWAINFNPAVRHHPIADITKLVLRHLYGTNISVSSDFTSFTMNKIFLPVPAPASSAVTNSSGISSTQSLTILADSSNVNGNNGTIFWNLDASAGSQRTVIGSFQSVNSVLAQQGEFVRVQARYQAGGTLVAVRVWASTSFSKVFVSPEGHVLSVNPSTASTNPDTFTIVTENGTASSPIQVTPNTNFYFNNALVGTGTGVLNNPGTTQPLFVRGFKVHVNPVDPAAATLTADTVNIEIARYAGSISGATANGFTYTRTFDAAHSSDNYTINLDYICSPGDVCTPPTPNGQDDLGNAITGFKWWDFAEPTSTLQDFNDSINPITGTNGFVNTVSASPVSYGTNCIPAGFSAALPATQPVVGESYATWNDPANPNDAWSAQWAVLLPTPAPLATVTTVPTPGGSSFGIMPINSAGTTGCASSIIVDLDTTPLQATLAYLVSRNGTGFITITSAGDLSVQTNLNALDTALSAPGTLVKVYGVPVASTGNGTLKAYVLFYFPTGTGVVQPAQ